MPSTQQLIIWRKQAANRLQQLLTGYTGEEVQPGDWQADTLLRQLSNLPTRPNDRLPFQGCFPDSPISVGRIKAANRIKQLVMNIKGDTFQPQDEWVDDGLRSLLNLPARNGKQSYTRLFPETPLPAITLDQLLQIARYADPNRVEGLLPHLLLTMAEYNITTPLRQTHFLAQLIHESGSFYYVEEIDSGEYLEGRTDLGNTEPGDGARYKGRGLIQITGRTNYDTCGQDLGVDLLNDPTRLMDDDLACLSAGWFWRKNDLNQYADADDVEMVTRTINGGLNGFDERQDFLAIAKEVLCV
jgi:putative chitinase